MLNVLARTRISRVLDPIGARLARAGVSPDVITVLGTVGVVTVSLVFVSQGHLLLGAIGVTVFALTDMLDGAIARARGTTSRWGAFLDSTMDRLADGAAFGSLAYWLAIEGRRSEAAAAFCCLIAGVIVSYAKARAEGLGMTANVGIAERTERLIIGGFGAILEVIGVPHGLEVVLWLLTALTVFTIYQRVRTVWQQSHQPAATTDGASRA